MATLTGHAARAAAQERLAALSSGVEGGTARLKSTRINWEDFNFPLRSEPCNILHFDLHELAQQDERAHDTVRFAYYWWLLLLAVVLVNLLNSIVLAAAVSDADIYRGLNVVYSFFNVFIAASVGTYAMYNVYRGLADHSRGCRRRGVAALCVLLVGALVQAILGAGNSNGFGSFASDRLDAADARGLGIVPYWKVAVIGESVAWLANVGLGAFTLFKLFTY